MSWPPQLPARYVMWPRPERALVGRGTFGEVWRAKDLHQGVLVALKILRERDARVQTRMEREAALGAKVVHPNVIALYDMGRTPEGLPFLAFPMASDGNLRRILGSPPPWSELLELLGDLLQALAALHSRGFLHLDVKLDNVLLHRAGARRRSVWLADLGVAVALYGGERDDRLIAGTIGYMPTEQLAGQRHLWGPPTDLFAFGAVAYRLLCGELPFPEREPLEAHGARYRPPATLPVVDGYVVPSGIADVLLPLLHPSPHGRYDRAADVWRALLALPPVSEAPGGEDDTPIVDADARFVPHVGGEPAYASAAWRDTRSSIGAMLVPTDREEAWELTPLEAPAWHRPAAKPIPRTLVRPPTPKRLSNAASLIVHREVPFVGRDRELDLLWQAGRWVADRQRPALFHIRGPRGIGRSRLAQEYTRMIEESGFGEGLLVALAGTDRPSTGLRGALRRLIPPHHDRAVWMNDVATLLARDRAAGIESCVDDARTLVDWLAPSPASAPIDLTRVVDLVAEHLAVRAWRGMAWLWIDDAQHASDDDPIFALVEQIYARKAPVLTVLVSRGAAPSAKVAELLRAHEKTAHDIELEPLPERAAIAFVQSHLPIGPELARQISRDTGGNPKYAREILVHWVRAGILVPEDATDGTAPLWTMAEGAPAFPVDRATFAQHVLAHAVAREHSHLAALLTLTEADEDAPERVLARAAGAALDHLVVEGLAEIEQGQLRLVPPELADAVRAWPRDPAIDAQVHGALADAWEVEGDPESFSRAARHRALAGS